MEFFIIKNNMQEGPFSIEELRSHNITSDTLVWAEGMAQWTPAWKVEELKPLFYGDLSKAGKSTPPPLPTAPADEPQTEIPTTDTTWQPSNPEDTKTGNARRDPKKWPWAIIILVALLVFMGVTNPSKNQHRAVINENVTQGLAKSFTEDDDVLSQGISAIGYMIAAPLINKMLDYMLEYHNYVLFSTTSIKARNGDVTISYGFLGNVFTANTETISRSIRSSINDIDNGKNIFDQKDNEDKDSDYTSQNNLKAKSSPNK
jgi:hypothetical protein